MGTTITGELARTQRSSWRPPFRNGVDRRVNGEPALHETTLSELQAQCGYYVTVRVLPADTEGDEYGSRYSRISLVDGRKKGRKSRQATEGADVLTTETKANQQEQSSQASKQASNEDTKKRRHCSCRAPPPTQPGGEERRAIRCRLFVQKVQVQRLRALGSRGTPHRTATRPVAFPKKSSEETSLLGGEGNSRDLGLDAVHKAFVFLVDRRHRRLAAHTSRSGVAVDSHVDVVVVLVVEWFFFFFFVEKTTPDDGWFFR